MIMRKVDGTLKQTLRKILRHKYKLGMLCLEVMVEKDEMIEIN